MQEALGRKKTKMDDCIFPAWDSCEGDINDAGGAQPAAKGTLTTRQGLGKQSQTCQWNTISFFYLKKNEKIYFSFFLNPTNWNSITRGNWFRKYLLIRKEWSRIVDTLSERNGLESKRRGRDLFRCFPSFWNKWKTTMFICTPSGKIDQGHFFMKENQPNLDGWFGEGPVLPGPKQSLKSFQKIRDNPVFSRTQ